MVILILGMVQLLHHVPYYFILPLGLASGMCLSPIAVTREDKYVMVAM